MNFTTFTGSSRRPRNVNLSGQPSNPNPFASSSLWNQPGDPSRTVHQAQADRQQRQRERERLQAARTIQRVYRGSLARAAARDQHRARFDAVYAALPMAGASADAAERVDRALSHLVRAFRLADRQDVDRLSRLCDDLALTGVAPLSRESPARMAQFLDDLLNVLDLTIRTDPLPETPVYLGIITSVVQEFASAVLVEKTADRLYYILGQVSSRPDLGSLWTTATVQAVVAPFKALPTSPGETYLFFMRCLLQGDRVVTSTNPVADADSAIARRSAYRAFAFEFLSTASITLFERDCAQFLAPLDLRALTAVITDDVPRALKDASSSDSFLWLLAHLIQLYGAATSYNTETILAPLYILLSSLGKEIRPRLAVSDVVEDPFDMSDESDLPAAAPLPSYVKAQLQSLVSTDSIKNILRQFSE